MFDNSEDVWRFLGMFCFSMLVAFAVATPIRNNIKEKIIIYQEAYQVTTFDDFKYVTQTSHEHSLIYGEVSAVSPVSFPEIQSEFAIIEKITEQYRDHTCTKTESYTDSSGNPQTRIVTEDCDSWDTMNREVRTNEGYSLYDHIFKISQVNFATVATLGGLSSHVASGWQKNIRGNYLYVDSKDFRSRVGNVRYYYRVLPSRFHATMFIDFSNGEVANPFGGRVDVEYERTIPEVISRVERSLKAFTWIFYIVWSILTVFGYIYFTDSFY